MEALAKLSARRPVAMSVTALVFAVLGYLSLGELPVDMLPDLQSPTVMVSLTAGQRPAVEMERLYGERIEQLLFTVRGLESIDQVARTGRLITRVTLNWDTDVDMALVEVNRAVALLAANGDVDNLVVRRFDPRQAPVLIIGMTSTNGDIELAELRRVAQRQVARGLERLNGVAEVRVTGGRVKQVEVVVDPVRLRSFGLSVGEVRQRIEAANVDIDAGTLVDRDEVFFVRGRSRFVNPDDIADVVLLYPDSSRKGGTAVRVGDVASVGVKDARIRNLVRVNGLEGVGLSVYKEAGANTVTVTRDVSRALSSVDEGLPSVRMSVVSDGGVVIQRAIDDVRVAALTGIALAFLVLVIYLRSPGPIIVVAVAVPVSLLATLFAMRLFDQSLNLMTLGGLALGAGMLVDNAIVVVESIFRKRSQGLSRSESASRGAAQVAGAIIASTLTTCVVFLPVLFVNGLTTRLVSGISFTVVISMLCSLLVAIFLIPALSVWLLPAKATRHVDPGAHWVQSFAFRSMGSPKLVVVLAVLISGFSVYSLSRLGTELLPPSDPAQFSLRIVGPPGQRVESTSVVVGNIEQILGEAADGAVQAVLSEVGKLDDDDRLIREFQTEENTAQMQVRLNPNGPGAEQVVAAAASAVEQLHGTDVTWEIGNSTLARALGTSGPPIVVEITGESLDELRATSQEVQQRLTQVAGLWNVRNSFEGTAPELLLTLQNNMADALGVDLITLSSAVQASLDGLDATSLIMGDEQRNVVIKLPVRRADQLLALPFLTESGQTITVGDVAQLQEIPGAKEIHRHNQRRASQVTALLRTQASAPQARQNVVEALEDMVLPPGLRIRLAGEELERKRTLSELRWAATLALLLVFMVIAGSFESFRHPITILGAIPVSLIGVAVVLVPLGHPIGVMHMLGLTVLLGVAVNDAILLVHAARVYCQQGMQTREALARAVSRRWRPIMMTTATTVLALVPLAIATGDAAQLRSPLALTVIGGVLASTLGSLLVVPSLYLIMDRNRVSVA